MNTSHLQSIIWLESRIQRLQEIYSLASAGEYGADELSLEIDAIESERPAFTEIYEEDLGPFDIDLYGAYQAIFREKLASYYEIKAAYEAEELPFEIYAEAFGAVVALWHYLEPWREHLRQEIESNPDWIESERRRALAKVGFRDPTQKRPTKKGATPAQLRAKAMELFTKAAQLKKG